MHTYKVRFQAQKQRDLIFYIPECPVDIRKPCGEDFDYIMDFKKNIERIFLVQLGKFINVGYL